MDSLVGWNDELAALSVEKPEAGEQITLTPGVDQGIDLSAISALNAQFYQTGSNLWIVFEDGAIVVVEGYFEGGTEEAVGTPRSVVVDGETFTGEEFLTAFSIDDLPDEFAEGDVGAPETQQNGASFDDPSLGPLGNDPNGIGLLGNTLLSPTTTALNENDPAFEDTDPIIGAIETGFLDEDALLAGGSVSITGSLNVDFGANDEDVSDSSDLQDTPTGAGNRSITFDAADVGAAVPLESRGVPLNFVLSEGDTVLTAFANGTPVFEVRLFDDGAGSYQFTLFEPLYHPDSTSEDDLGLTFSFTATDSNGDTASATFSVSINDDVPEVSNPDGSAPGVSNALLDEDDIAAVAGVQPAGNDRTDAAEVSGNLKVTFGADGFGSTQFSGAFAIPTVGSGTADEDGVDSGLTSDGRTVLFRVVEDGTKLEAFVAATGQSDEEIIFEATLDQDSDAGYTVRLFGNIDHAADKDAQSINFTVIATDFDEDSVDLTLSVRLTDDAPVVDSDANARIVLDDDDVESRDGNPGFGSDTSDGADSDNAPRNTEGTLDLSFGADGGSVSWDAENSQVNGRAPDVSFSEDNGDLVISQLQDGTLVEIARFTLNASTGQYVATQSNNLLHFDNGEDNENDQGFTLAYQVTDGDGDTANGFIQLTIDDDMPVADDVQSTKVDEDGLSDGTDFRPGSQNRDIDLAISWGADGAVSQRSLDFADSNGDAVADGSQVNSLASLGITATHQGNSIETFTSDGVPVLFTISDNAEGGQTLLAYKEGTTGADGHIFSINLNTETTQYEFQLLGNLDHPADGNVPFSSLTPIVFTVDFIAEDGDGDTVSSSFEIELQDDQPEGTEPNNVRFDEDRLPDGGNDFEADQAAAKTVQTQSLNIVWGADNDIVDENAGDTFGRTLTFIAEGGQPLSAGDSYSQSQIDIRVAYSGGAPETSALSSWGAELVFKIEDLPNGGQLLTAYKDGGTPEADAVFKVTLDPTAENGAYTVEMIDSLDHGVPDAGSDRNNIQIDFGYQGFDADGDAIKGNLDGTLDFKITIDDDAPVIDADAIENSVVEEEQGQVAGSGIEDTQGTNDEDFRDGFLGWRFNDETTHEADGGLGINWGADDANPSAGVGANDRGVTFASSLGGLTSLTSRGDAISYELSDDGTILTAIATDDDTGATRTVFTVTLSDEGNGSYEFTLIDTLDHPSNAQGEDSLELTFDFVATDSDGDTAEASFDVTVVDDQPITFGTILPRFVEEEGLSDGNQDGLDFGTSATGLLNIYWGGDDTDNADSNSSGTLVQDDPSVAGQRSVIFSDANNGPIDAADVASFLSVTDGDGNTVPLSSLTSNGEALTFNLSNNGTILTAEADGQPVFTVTLSDDDNLIGSGSYTFNLLGTLDHPIAGNSAGDEDVLTFTFDFTASDGDGDFATGNFEVRIVDDSPVATGTATITVDEDDIVTFQSLGNEPFDGAGDGSTTGVFDFIAGPAFARGNLNDIVSFGADGPAQDSPFGFSNDASQRMESLGLTSKGQALSFTVVSITGSVDVLVGYVDSNGNGSYNLFADRTVVSFTLDEESGEYQARLFDQLDHENDGNNNENTALATTNQGVTLPGIDFGSAIEATDGDGDTILLDNGAVVVSVTDDVPDPEIEIVDYVRIDETFGNHSDNTNNGFVKALFAGVSNQGHDDGFPDTIYARFDVVDVEENGGADDATSTLAFRVVDASSGLKTTSGDDITLAVEGDLVVGRTASGEAVFAIHIDDDGNISIAQYVSLRHPDETSSDEHISLTDKLELVFTVTDGDGDAVEKVVPIGDEVITFDDDGPSIGNPRNSWVDEEGLGGNIDDPYPGDRDGSETSATGNLRIDWGADEENPTSGGGLGDRSVSFVASQPGLAGLTSNDLDVLIEILIDGTLVGYTGATPTSIGDDGVVFYASLSDANNGSYQFTLLQNLDHPVPGEEDNLRLDFAFTATDADGDTDSDTFTVRVDDDAPIVDWTPQERTNNFRIISDDDTVKDANGDPIGNAGGVQDSGEYHQSGKSLPISFGADGGSVVWNAATSQALSGVAPDAPVTFEVESVTGDLLIKQNQGGSDLVIVARVTLDPATGAYTYTQLANLLHDDQGNNIEDDATFNLGFTVEDGDGDIVEDSLPLIIDDDTPVIAQTFRSVDLDEANINDTGSNQFNVDFGADGFGGQVFAGTIRLNIGPGTAGNVSLDLTNDTQTTSDLTSGGEAITFERINDTTIIGYVTNSSEPIIQLTLNNDNTGFTAELFGAIDHFAASDGSPIDSVRVDADVIITDGDGDAVSAVLRTNINDDTPEVASADGVTVDEAGTQSVADQSATFSGALNGVTYNFSITQGSTDLFVSGPGITGQNLVTLDVLAGLANGEVTARGNFGVDDPNPGITGTPVSANSNGEFIVNIGGLNTGGNYKVKFDNQSDADAFANFAQTLENEGLLNEAFRDNGQVSQTGNLNVGWGADDQDVATNNFNQDTPGGTGNRSVTFQFLDPSETASNIVYIDGGTEFALTSGGTELSYVLNADGTKLTATAGDGGPTIFVITLDDDDTGGYKFELLGPLDHVKGRDDSDLEFDVKFTATDGDGDTVSGSFEVTVNDDVPEAADDTVSVLEDESVSFSVLGNDDSGADGVDFADVAVVNGPSKGSLDYDEDTGEFTYTPDANENGADSFTYSITDGDGDTSEATVSITITPVNDAPEIAGDISGSVVEQGLVQGVAQANAASDLEPTLALNSTVEAALDNLLIDPSSVDDAIAAVLAGTGGDLATAIAVVWDYLDDNYTQSPGGTVVVNEAFVRLGVEYAAYLKDGGQPLMDVVAKFTADNDSDADNDPERLQALHDNLLGNLNTASLASRFSGTQLGELTDLITDVDANLLSRPVYSGNEGTDESAVRAFDVANGYDQSTVSGQLTASDVDAGAVLTWADGVTVGTYGTFTLDATGKWTYELDEALSDPLAVGQIETEVFTVTVTDEHGAPATQDVTITITGTNDAPVIAGDISGSVVETGEVAGIAQASAAGDLEPTLVLDLTVETALNDLLNDPTKVSDAIDTVQAQTGSDRATAIAVVWDFLDDNYTQSPGGTVVVNEAFVRLGVEYASYLKDGGQPLVSVVAKFSADSPTDSDSDPERLQTLHDNLLGNLNSSPLGSRFGDPLLSELTDLIVGVDGALLGRPIYSGNEGADDTGTRAFDSANGYDGPTVSGQLTASDVDTGAVLTWSDGVTVGAYGSFTVDATGKWTYQLDDTLADRLAAGQSATEVFTVSVTDDQGATTSEDVTITITGTNDAPVVVDTNSAEAASADLVEEDNALEVGDSQYEFVGLQKLEVSDVDNTTFSEVTFEIESGVGSLAGRGNNINSYNSDNGTDIQVTTNGSVLTFTSQSGTLTVDDVNAILGSGNKALARFVMPDNVGASETTVIKVSVTDAGDGSGGLEATSEPYTLTLNISGKNDTPFLQIGNTSNPLESDAGAGTGFNTPPVLTADAGGSFVLNSEFGPNLFFRNPDDDTGEIAGTPNVVTISVENGTLSLPGSPSGVSGSGTSSLEITGDADDITSLLRAVEYTPNTGFSGSDKLVVEMKDGGDQALPEAAATVSFPIQVAPATALFVGGESGDFATLQLAVKAASAGDKIIVRSGYTSVGDTIIDKELTILGEDNFGLSGTSSLRGAESTIQGQITITSNDPVVIDGLRVLNPSGSAAGFRGITLQNADGHGILNTVFFSDVAGGDSGKADWAIYSFVDASGELTITGNFFTGSQTGKYSDASWERGIWLNGGGHDADISSNTFQYTRTGMNIEDNSDAVTVTNNTFSEAGSGISIGSTDQQLDNISDNTFDDVDTGFNIRNVSTPIEFDLGGTSNSADDPLDYMVVLGGSADDTLGGSTGNDALFGNNGQDTVVFDGVLDASNFVPVADVDPGTDTVPGWQVDATGIGEGTDILAGVEIVQGADPDGVGGSTGRFLLVGNGGFSTIQEAIDASVDGDTILVGPGTYTLSSTLIIDKSLTVIGAGEGQTTLDASAGTSYGILVEADGTTLKGFTLKGPADATGGAGDNYGIKVQPDSGDPADRLNDFTLEDVTVSGSLRSEIDLNGVDGATFKNVTADGMNTGGVGIALTDSANITLEDITTTGNDWGSVALFNANRFYDQQTGNITFEGTYSATEDVKIYAQDSSDGGLGTVAETDLGTVDFNAVGTGGWTVVNPDHRVGGDQFTFYFENLTDAGVLAIALQSPPSTVNTSSVIQAPNGDFHVLPGMSIQAAIDAANHGDTIVIAPGTYNEDVSIDGKAITLLGDGGPDGVIIEPGAGQAGVTVSGVIAGDVIIDGITFQNSDSGVSASGNSFTIGNLIVQNSKFLNNAKHGVFVNGKNDGVGKVTVQDSTFENNGDGSTNGDGDIVLFEYRGDATLKNLVIDNSSGSGTADTAIQIAGFEQTDYDVNDPIGVVEIDGVQIDGAYAKVALYIQGYTDLSDLSLVDVSGSVEAGWGYATYIDPMSSAELGAAADSVGRPGAFNDAAADGSVDLSGVTLANTTVLAVGAGHPLEAFNGTALQSIVNGTTEGETIIGTAGVDLISGRDGDDIILGGLGNDLISGGNGEDTFVLNDLTGVDTILDYTQGEDRIDLTALLNHVNLDDSNKNEFVRVLSDGTVEIDQNGATGGDNFTEVAILDNFAGSSVTVIDDNTTSVEISISTV